MLGLTKSRLLISVLGLALLSAIVWYAGEYVRFGFGDAEFAPLESPLARLVAIGLLWACWIASIVIKRLRAARASDKLMAEVVKPSRPEKEQPSAEALQLREGFEGAVATLTKKRRSGHSLYEIPWYVIIGAPGSGKTTALANSGLRFPVEQRGGKAIRGIGGTRNCDWWFTDEAVFLDTAGRYLTQDSDANADSAAWAEFLGLLRKYRGRRPVNGVILTISAQDLMVQGLAGREVHVMAARRRLEELNKELRLDLPVYLLVTKCDLLAGFAEYFDDLTPDGRAQVWGTTFAHEQTMKGDAPRAFPAEFDALVGRLNERLFARLEEDRDIRRRARIFGLPQQVAALRDALKEFVTDVFASTRLDKRVLLRGVYFTSGTQEGTPIDRLLGAIGRQFAVAPDAVSSGRGKAYFIERLLKEVLFAESGLAGVNRRLEAQKGALEIGAYVAMVLAAGLGIFALNASYRRNRAYVAEVGAEVAKSSDVLRNAPPTAIGTLLARLDAVRAASDVANQYRGATPWGMRWGLFQGASLGDAARDAYLHELNGALLSQTAERIRARLPQLGPEPERLYEYLKAYLMLGDPARLDKDHLAYVADEEWNLATGDPNTAAGLSKHVALLLEDAETLRPIPVDRTLIAQARSTIGQDSVATFIYRAIRRNYQSGDDPNALRLDVVSGIGAAQVLRRKSGRPLSEPVSSLYTASVFKDLTSRIPADVVKQFAADQWVWGEGAASRATVVTLVPDVLTLYEDDYIRVWDELVADVGLVSMSTQQSATEALGYLAAEGSPLRGFLKTVDTHTYLVPPPDPAQAKGAFGRVEGLIARGRALAGGSTVVPGTRVTAHFAPIHQAVTGPQGGAPIDVFVRKFGEIQKELRAMGGGVGEARPGDPGSVARVGSLATDLKREAAILPPTVAAVVGEVAEGTLVAVRGGVSSTLGGLYQDVVRQCREFVDGRYPFVASSTVDLPLADFGRLFGYGGVYETFFKTQVEQYVTPTANGWTWKTVGSGASVGGGLPLSKFEAARRIREMFFRNGAQEPDVRFRLTPKELAGTVARFVLEVGGQRLEDNHGPPRSLPVTWPGANPGPAVATFIPRQGPQVAVPLEGPWAWFRLIDKGLIERETNARFLLRFESGGQYAVLTIEAESVNNPFGKTELQQFRCS